MLVILDNTKISAVFTTLTLVFKLSEAEAAEYEYWTRPRCQHKLTMISLRRPVHSPAHEEVSQALPLQL